MPAERFHVCRHYPGESGPVKSHCEGSAGISGTKLLSRDGDRITEPIGRVSEFHQPAACEHVVRFIHVRQSTGTGAVSFN